LTEFTSPYTLNTQWGWHTKKTQFLIYLKKVLDVVLMAFFFRDMTSRKLVCNYQNTRNYCLQHLNL